MGNWNDSLVGMWEGNDVIQWGEGNDSILWDLQDTVAGAANDVLVISEVQEAFELTEEWKKKIEFICKILQEWNLPRSTQFAVFWLDDSEVGGFLGALWSYVARHSLDEVDLDLLDYLKENASQDTIERCDLMYQIKRVLVSVYGENINEQKRFLEAENPYLDNLSPIAIFNTKDKGRIEWIYRQLTAH